MFSTLLQRYFFDYRPQKYENCPIEAPMILHFSFSNESENNKLTYSGFIQVTDDVHGEIELVMESNKCSLDMKTCVKYDTVNIREMCKKLEMRNTFYSSALTYIKPPFVCPFKAGNYTFQEATLDLTVFSFLPVFGYVWVSTFKLVSGQKGSKTKRVVMCLNTESKLVKRRI